MVVIFSGCISSENIQDTLKKATKLSVAPTSNIATLSVSFVDFSTNGDVFTKQALVTFTTGLGQSLQFKKDLAPITTSTGITSSKPFSLTYGTTFQGITYGFEKTANYVYSIDFVNKGFKTNGTWWYPVPTPYTASECSAFQPSIKGGFAYLLRPEQYGYKDGSTPRYVSRCYIYVQNPVAQLANMPKKVSNFEGELSISNGDNTYSGKVTEQNRVLFLGPSGKNIAQINVQGTLGSFNLPQSFTEHGLHGMWLYSQNKWAITKQLTWQAYTTYVGDFRNGKCVGQQLDPLNYPTPSSCAQAYNVRGLGAITEAPDYLSLMGATKDYNRTAKLEGASIVLDFTNAPIVQPIITAKLDADWIGIIAPEGIPKIISTADCKFSSGSNGILSVNVQNIGINQGSFSPSLSCGPAISIERVPQNQVVPKGGTTTFSWQLGGQVLGKDAQSEGCRITITDANSGKSDTSQQTCSISPIPLPVTDGTLRCGPTGIEIAQNNQWVVQKVCEQGTTCRPDSAGTPKCVTPIPPPPPPCDPAKEDCAKKSLYQLCVAQKEAELSLLGKLNPFSLEKKVIIPLQCTWEVYKANLAFGLVIGILLLVAMTFLRFTRHLIIGTGILGLVLSGGILIGAIVITVFSISMGFVLFIIALLMLIAAFIFRA